jgi:hypothetical protein
MPRQSVEAKAGARFRARPKNELPQPPEHLSLEARKIWARILSTKPADWFDEGSLVLLAQFCDLVAEQAKLVLQRTELEQLKPTNILDRTEVIKARLDINKAIREFALASTTAATKLRLTVQNTIDRKSGVLSEKPPEAVVAAAARSSLLSGRQLDA